MSSGVRVGDVFVHGIELDVHTRCIHYRSTVDIVAIQFSCCRQWYSCLYCHEEVAEHPILPWPADAAATQAALCGECGKHMTITQYREADRCPHCEGMFNEGCALHHPVYFG